MINSKAIKYSADELAFIETNCTLVISALTSKFNAKFNRDISPQNIHGLRKRNGWRTGRTGCYEKGCTPLNKGKKMDCGPNVTSFKKGHKPHNWKPIGSTRITHDGYTQRKMTDTGYPPRDWVEVHRLLWIKHNKTIPKNNMIIFIDGDKSNIVIENLTMVTMAENAVINKNKLRDVPCHLKQAGITLGKVIHKTSTMEKRQGNEPSQ